MTTVENAVMPETPVIDLRDVAEQPVHALGEDQVLALLGGVGLDDPDAAERLVQAAGDLGLILPRSRNSGRRRWNATPSRRRTPPSTRIVTTVRSQLDRGGYAEREHGGDDAAGELHEPGADEVADAFGVVHDRARSARRSASCRSSGPAAASRALDAAPHVGDRALRGDAEDLRQRERRSRPGRASPPPTAQRERRQQLDAPLPMTSSIRNFDVAGRTRPASAADEHQRQARATGGRGAPRSRSRASSQAADQRTFFFLGTSGRAASPHRIDSGL